MHVYECYTQIFNSQDDQLTENSYQQ